MIEHSCKDCVFQTKINEQSGCSLGRLNLIPHKIDENGDAVLSRFCNTSRPVDWLDDLSLEESSDLVATVMKEVRPRVGFFVLFNKNLEDLQNTLNDIAEQTISSRYVIVINDAVEYNQAIQSLFTERFDFSITRHHIVQVVNKPEISDFLIDEAFKHAKNGWAYVCHSGHRIDKNIIEKIDTRINIEMKKLVVVEPYDSNLNGLLFQTALFKFLNGNGLKIFDEENFSDALFLDKVKDVSKRSDPETFITWEDFNGQS